jgi:hypothetical protein
LTNAPPTSDALMAPSVATVTKRDAVRLFKGLPHCVAAGSRPVLAA